MNMVISFYQEHTSTVMLLLYREVLLTVRVFTCNVVKVDFHLDESFKESRGVIWETNLELYTITSKNTNNHWLKRVC